MSEAEFTVNDIDDFKRDLNSAMKKHGRWVYGQPATALGERWDAERRAVVLSYMAPDGEVAAVCQSFSTATEEVWSVTFDSSTERGQQLINRVVVEIAQPAGEGEGEPAESKRKKKLIRSETFDGDLDAFRAMMDRLAIHHSNRWQSNSDELWFTERRRDTPKRWAWHVEIPVPIRDGKRGKAVGCAGIEATEKPDGDTLIEFFDGYFVPNPMLKRPAIGAAFEEFCEMVVSEMEKWTAQPAGEGDGEPAEPKRQKTPRWDVQVRGTKAYNRIHKENQAKTAACNMEGIDPRTYDEYLEEDWIPLEDKDME